jgi:hypothetical protein
MDQPMSDRVVRTFNSPDGKRRVLIVQRNNGSFGYEEEYFSEHPEELCWCPLTQRPFSICDSEATALREAFGRIDWLQQLDVE